MALSSAVEARLPGPLERGGRVRLWWVPVGPARVGAWEDLLTEDERARAASYRRPADRAAFAARRAGLRLLLAAELGAAPLEVRFGADGLGRPRLENPRGSDLTFSVSSRGAWAAIALGRGVDVAVDLEQLVDLPFDELAAYALGPDEREAIRGSRDPRRAFFEAWTRFEALVKLEGRGLAAALAERVGGAAEVANVPAPEGYVAALAVATPRSGPPR